MKELLTRLLILLLAVTPAFGQIASGESVKDSLNITVNQGYGHGGADINKNGVGRFQSLILPGGTVQAGALTQDDLSDNNTNDLADVIITSPATGQMWIYQSGGTWQNKTISGDVTVDANGVMTIQSNSVALTTDTTGNYVANVQTSTGLTGGSSGSEGAALTISLNFLGLQSLTDPNADRIYFWDDSSNSSAWLTAGSTLSISGTTIDTVLGNTVDLASEVTGILPAASVGNGLTDAQISDSITVGSGGSVNDAALSANITKLGSTISVSEMDATGTKDGTKFLRDDNTWAVPSGTGGTGNVTGPLSSTAHGLARYADTTGQVLENGANINLATETTGTLPASSVGNGLTDAQVSDSITVGSGGSVNDAALSVNVSKLGSTIEGSEITDDTVVLSTDTSGNYVASANTGLGLTGGSSGSEGAGLTIALDESASLSGDHSLSASQEKFGANGLIFEGATANTFEGYLTVADVTADRTWTLPNNTGTIVTTGDTGSVTGTMIANDTVALTTDTSGNYVTSVATGNGLTGGASASEGATLTLSLDESASLSGDHSLSANGWKPGANGIIFEGATADTIEGYLTVTDPTSSDKTWTLPNTTGTLITTGDSGTVTGTMILNDTVALTTDTSGNYVATITAGNGISGSSSTEGGTPTIAIDNSASLASDGSMSANGGKFASNGIILEGATADSNEGYLTLTDPTADNTFTLPNKSGTIAMTSDLTGISTSTVVSIFNELLGSNFTYGPSGTYKAVDPYFYIVTGGSPSSGYSTANSELGGTITLGAGATALNSCSLRLGSFDANPAIIRPLSMSKNTVIEVKYTNAYLAGSVSAHIGVGLYYDDSPYNGWNSNKKCIQFYCQDGTNSNKWIIESANGTNANYTYTTTTANSTGHTLRIECTSTGATFKIDGSSVSQSGWNSSYWPTSDQLCFAIYCGNIGGGALTNATLTVDYVSITQDR